MSGLTQLSLFESSNVPDFLDPDAVTKAIDSMASNNVDKGHGAVFTRIEVVDFILDLVGYSVDKPLFHQRILEPSFGDGDFLIAIVDRLIASWKMSSHKKGLIVEELGGAIQAVELHKDTYKNTRKVVLDRLETEGLSSSLANTLINKWLVQGDFLLEQQKGRFDYIVGNPPYVRQELIPAPLLSEYRRRFRTIFDRADLYIPFIEHSLSLLNKSGTLGFICSDRWMKNRYGGPLRKFISQGFHLKIYIDMVDTDAFHSKVSTYPAITIIKKEKGKLTRIAHRPEIDKQTLVSMATDLSATNLPKDSVVKEIVGVANGTEPWILESSDQTALIQRLEKEFPAIEQAGCKVGIGVATGADNAFIGDFESLDVESDRKLPLVATRDIQTGEVVWQGKGVINPFAEFGRLVDLTDYPKLASYLEERKTIIGKRHCAKKAPSNWYRTIDRIWPDLAQKPKLLIPDIKGEAHIVYEPGKYYPHHNLYYVTTETWDLRALQAVLLSSIAKLFITTYSTKMRGGYLRFQAQYLRRIRVPFWQDVSEELRRELIQAAISRDVDACNSAVFKLYGLNHLERSALCGNGE